METEVANLGGIRDLSDRSIRSEERRPEERLDVDDGLRVGHVVLLGDHGALLVHHHHGVGESHPAPQQAVEAGRGKTSQ